MTDRESLPLQLTSFVGRKAELAALRKALKKNRLVTLIGPGGIGKTRLATEAARSLRTAWRDGIWWVDLASVTDPSQLAAAVAAAIRSDGTGRPMARIEAALRTATGILVLDNCEHLVGASAELCRSVLRSCPEITILATSREALGLAGEAQVPLSPLRPADASNLFEQRGRLVRPDYRLTNANQAQVAGICKRLDDLPLAIELAASKLALLSEREISKQLEARFEFLSVPRSGDQRHVTMAAAIDWSYRLLSPTEAALFRRLSVFRGGFTLEAAEVVCRDSQVSDVVGTLAGLVTKSMAAVQRTDEGDTRYYLLESQIAFAEDRLKAAGEAASISQRHYGYFLQAVAARTSAASGALADVRVGLQEVTWKRRELPNLWAALAWGRDNSADRGFELAAFMIQIGDVDLAALRSWLTDLLRRFRMKPELPGHSSRQTLDCTWVYHAAAELAYRQGDYVDALKWSRAAVRWTTHLASTPRRVGGPDSAMGYRDSLAGSLIWVGNALTALGRYQPARRAYQRALSLIDSKRRRVLLASVYNALGSVDLHDGRYQVAERNLRRALDISKSVKTGARTENQIANILESLANVQLALGDVAAATEGWRQALVKAREYGEVGLEIVCLSGLARAASAAGNHERAVRLAAANARSSDVWADVDWPFARKQLSEALAQSRSVLGPKTSDDAWRQGMSLNLDQAVDYALQPSSPVAAPLDDRLTRRQVEIVRMLATGATNKEIGARLFRTERTVEGHLDRIRAKLDLKSRVEIAAWANAHGLAPASDEEKGTLAGPPSRTRTRSN